MAYPSKFDLYNRLLGGRLPEILTDLKKRYATSEVLFRLRVDYNIEVSDETLRRWLQKVTAA